MIVIIKKAPNQAKDRINMVCVTLEILWLVSDWHIEFRFFVKFHKSGPVIIFSFWTTTELVRYASKMLLIKETTSSTWWVLLWKYYRWFLIDMSIFEFFSSFTGPDLSKFSISELIRCMLVIHQHGVFYSGRLIDDLWQIYRFSIFCQLWHVQTCNNFQFLNYHGACLLRIKKPPNQAKDFINMLSVTLEVLWMISDRIVDFRFFVNFQRSGPGKIFSFWTISEHDI